MKRALFSILAVIFLIGPVSAQNLFTADVVDTKDYEYTLSDLYFQYEDDTTQFFRCLQGRAKFGLHFSRIDSIAFSDSPDAKIPGFRESSVKFMNGKESKIHIYQYYTLIGDNTDIGSRVEIPVSDIKSLKFRHGGDYSRCDLCGMTYYDLGQDICPFDGQKLKRISTGDSDARMEPAEESDTVDIDETPETQP